MKATVTTTVTTSIDIDTLEPTHDVAVECNDGLPQNVVVAAAIGGLKSSLAALESGRTS